MNFLIKFYFMWICINTRKIRLFHRFVLEIEIKIPQSLWLRTFWPTSQEQKFSKIWDLCRNTPNNRNFHYRTSSEKIKDYLRYKTITSQNVPSKAQIKNFFISYKNYVPFSKLSSFRILNHPMIYQISEVKMSISTRDKVHFWIYLLNHKSWSRQTWPVDRYKQGQ